MQIDCDVVPCDSIIVDAAVQNEKLTLLSETYDCLIVPYSEALPSEVLLRFIELTEKGLPVFFVGGLPARTSEGGKGELVEQLKRCKHVKVVALEDLAQKLKSSRFTGILTNGSYPFLRYYHVRHQDMDVFMFFNEHSIQYICTEAILPVKGSLVFDG